MAIQTVDLTVPNGDTPRSANTKINLNFTDQANAASRLVGSATGNVMEVGAFGLGGGSLPLVGNAAATSQENNPKFQTGFLETNDLIGSSIVLKSLYGTLLIGGSAYSGTAPQYVYYNSSNGNKVLTGASVQTFWTTQNTTKDSNGFLKGASPIVDLYSGRVELNLDAEKQNITFDKVSVGNYLVKGSLGFAQEGWYIETPKDANGNVLVAVTYEQLANNDISVKTYTKKFDDETGDIVANLLKPRDIPTGRFISLRMHELPKEPPVMPNQDTSADAPAQTNNP